MTIRKTKNNIIWSSKAAKILVNKTKSKDPIDAVLKLSKQLIQQSGIKEPPFKPKILAEIQGIKKIEPSKIDCDASLLPFPDGYVIEVNADHSDGRKNFSCCHEIVHTFFSSDSNTKLRSQEYNCFIDLFREEQEEEYLCNIGAAELIMPLNFLFPIALEYQPSPEAIQKLCSLFKSSLQAMIYRILKTSVWECIIVKWKKWVPIDNSLNKEYDFYVDWAGSSNLPYRFSRYSSLSQDSHLSLLNLTYETAKKTIIVFEHQNLVMESIKISDKKSPYILSVVKRNKEQKSVK